jgi:flavin reductase (DIM6/NTAB) family NADH-FMN oxidoreductase RutF
MDDKKPAEDRDLVEPVEGEKYFHYYPQLVAVIGVMHNGKTNFAPCAWSTGLSYNPFLFGVSVGKDRFTHGVLTESDAFTVNFLDFHHFRLVRSLGRSSGAEIDKAKEFNVSYAMGKKAAAPVMDAAYYALECRKQEAHCFGDHTLFVGAVVLMHVSRSLAQAPILNTELVSPLLYLGVDHYITTDKASRACLKDLPFHYKRDKRR